MSFARPPAGFPVASGVTGLRTIMVNVYLVASADSRSWVLVDAGLRGSGPKIMREAERRFGAHTPPSAIVLTHAHFDHAGALPWLLERWRSPVFAHPRELPYLNEGRAYPPPDPTVGGGIMAWSSSLYPRRPATIPIEARALPSDGSVPGMPDWHWLFTPGHTDGHVALFRAGDRTLISGDAVISTRQESALAVWRQTPELRPPPAYFTPDWANAYHSFKALRQTEPAVIATGHGLPLHGASWLRGWDEMIEHFDARALPPRGRYVPTHWSPA